MAENLLNQLDVAFIVDVTGSMGAFIDIARQHMIAMLRRLTTEAALPIDLRLAIVEYRDHPPQDHSFVTREHDFTQKLSDVQRIIEDLKPDGGGDVPEAVFDGLKAAAELLDWRQHSRRLAILIGDAPPHGWSRRGEMPQGTCLCNLTADAATAVLEQNDIILHGLGLTPHVDGSFAWLARATGGSYFAAHRGQDAITALETLMAREFSDLEFDRRVLDARHANPTVTVEEVAADLEVVPGRVAASLSRLGRRGILREKSVAFEGAKN